MKGNKSVHLKIIFLITVMLAVIPFAVGFDDVSSYAVRHDGQVTTVTTNRLDIKSILRAAQVKLGEHDKCTINRREKVVDVVRAKAFTLTDRRGRVSQQYSTCKTVGAALKQLEVDYEDATIYPQPKTLLEAGMQVHVLPPGERLVLTEEELPFEVEYYEDDTLDYGLEKVGRHGKVGKLLVASKAVVGPDGKESLVELERKQVEEPKKQIVRRGMKQAVETPEGWKRYSKKLVAHTTAYTIHCGNGDGLTSIGLVPRVGIVAVDPKVIPYYTKMYIPGYGIAIAGDCGGAINGNDVDVFVESYDDAIRWGRRNVEIYILEE